jgi:hypothetical protein
MPENCPFCGGEVEQFNDKGAYGCENRSYPEGIKALSWNFASRPGFYMKGLAENRISALGNTSMALDYVSSRAGGGGCGAFLRLASVTGRSIVGIADLLAASRVISIADGRKSVCGAKGGKNESYFEV